MPRLVTSMNLVLSAIRHNFVLSIVLSVLLALIATCAVAWALGPEEVRPTRQERWDERWDIELYRQEDIRGRFPTGAPSDPSPVQPSSQPEELRLDPQAFMYRRVATSFSWRTSPFSAHRLEQLCSATGLRTGALGISFATMRCEDQLRHRQVRSLVDAASADRISSAMFAIDYLGRIDRCAENVDRSRRLTQLRDKGWAAVGSWGLDLVALQAQSRKHLEPLLAAQRRSSGGVDVISVKNPDMPALKPLLSDPSLAALLEAHLGGAVRYDGHVLLHVGERSNPDVYASARWHHDRCGHRIKVFVFMHDVHHDGRPTLIAEASHHTLYYMYMYSGGVRSSRITSDYVASHYRVVPMLGAAGGGFVFDTNTLHRGMHEGNATRTTVILEFHRHDKIRALKALGHDGPCPSTVTANKTVNAYGFGGFPLFPPDSPSDNPRGVGSRRVTG